MVTNIVVVVVSNGRVLSRLEEKRKKKEKTKNEEKRRIKNIKYKTPISFIIYRLTGRVKNLYLFHITDSMNKPGRGT